jgi:ABC-type sugar transport system permease subunit
LPRRRRVNPAYLFVAPSVLALAVFTLWPILQALWISFHDWSFLTADHAFVGLGNFTELLADRRFWNALKNTFLYTFGSVTVQIGIALGLALMLNERLPLRPLARSAFFFPVISSLAVMGIVWSFLIDPDIGVVAQWMTSLGLPRIDWLRNPATALIAVTAVGVWKSLGFSMVILLAGLQGIPQEHYEAAALDGAGRFARFRHITVPGLRHTLLFVFVITITASLQVFDQVYVMTGGGPIFATETLVTYMVHQGFDLFRMGYASAIAWVLFLLILVVSTLQLRVFRYRDVD